MTAQGFANAAAASDKFEIDSSKLAATAASSAAVKSFADQDDQRPQRIDRQAQEHGWPE